MQLQNLLLPLALLAVVSPVTAQAPTTASPPAATPPAISAVPAKPAAAADNEDKSFPSQSSVAAKMNFQTLPASDKALVQALDAKALTVAAKMVGKPGSFQGTVVSVYSPGTHSFVALDFAAHYRDALTADIAPADYAKFPDLTQLRGKHVLVSGQFVTKGTATQLAVTRPDEIKIVP